MNDSPAPAPVPPAGSPEALAAGLDWAFARLDTGNPVTACVRSHLGIGNNYSGSLERQIGMFVDATASGTSIEAASHKLFALLRKLDPHVDDAQVIAILYAVAERSALASGVVLEPSPWFPGLREASGDPRVLAVYIGGSLGMVQAVRLGDISDAVVALRAEVCCGETSALVRTLLEARRVILEVIPEAVPFMVDRLLEEFTSIVSEAARPE